MILVTWGMMGEGAVAEAAEAAADTGLRFCRHGFAIAAAIAVLLN